VLYSVLQPGSAMKHNRTTSVRGSSARAKLRRAKHHPHNSEWEWQEIFEHTPVMYFMIDAVGTVLNVNALGAAQLGYSVIDLIGRSVLTTFFEEDREFMRNCVADCVRTIGQSHTWEVRKVRKNGSVLWVRENARAVRRGDSELLILVACEDITERKQTENALRLSEAFLAGAQELSRTGSFGWSVATGELVWSRETYQIFQYDQTEKPTLELSFQRIHPEDRAVLQKTIELASSSGKDFNHEHRLLMPDGSVKYLHCLARATRSASGSIEFVGAVTDITAAKEAEQKLRESEQRFRDYVETASDWYWVWESDRDHRLTRITCQPNAAGLVSSNLIGHRRWDFASDSESEPEKWQQHRATLDAHLPFRDFVYRATSRTGASIYVRTSGKPIFDTSGNFFGYRGVESDISVAYRADQAERELRKAQLELAHVTRLTTLGELTASIAHEINQPLGGVMSNAQACLGWLCREPPDLEAVRRSVKWIIDDCNRASEVIQRVRALAKKTDIEKVPLDINDLVKDVVALVQRELVSHAVSVQMEQALALPRILGDWVQLQQVMINLVINGIEAMESVVDRSRELVIRSCKDDGDQLIVTVTDCGIGISPEVAEHLFDPFYTTKSGGLGMGLSICRSIVEAHGGRISARRNDGVGTTFQVALPFA
jgi:PAS domain S-box-containing protein